MVWRHHCRVPNRVKKAIRCSAQRGSCRLTKNIHFLTFMHFVYSNTKTEESVSSNFVLLEIVLVAELNGKMVLLFNYLISNFVRFDLVAFVHNENTMPL